MFVLFQPSHRAQARRNPASLDACERDPPHPACGQQDSAEVLAVERAKQVNQGIDGFFRQALSGHGRLRYRHYEYSADECWKKPQHPEFRKKHL
jgi:hypothetical protein